MKVKKQQVEERMVRFTEVCRAESIKLPPPQRMEIFREVAQTGNQPDAKQIFQRVRKKNANSFVRHYISDTLVVE